MPFPALATSQGCQDATLAPRLVAHGVAAAAGDIVQVNEELFWCGMLRLARWAVVSGRQFGAACASWPRRPGSVSFDLGCSCLIATPFRCSK